MKQYRVRLSGRWGCNPLVVEAEVDRQTEASVWIRGCRHAKKSEFGAWFESFKDAKAALEAAQVCHMKKLAGRMETARDIHRQIGHLTKATTILLLILASTWGYSQETNNSITLESMSSGEFSVTNFWLSNLYAPDITNAANGTLTLGDTFDLNSSLTFYGGGDNDIIFKINSDGTMEVSTNLPPDQVVREFWDACVSVYDTRDKIVTRLAEDGDICKRFGHWWKSEINTYVNTAAYLLHCPADTKETCKICKATKTTKMVTEITGGKE